MKGLTLEDFKNLVNTDNEFVNNITKRKDIIDKKHGIMRIYPENINKYLEEYYCKNVDELEDKLYHCYGIYCTIIE